MPKKDPPLDLGGGSSGALFFAGMCTLVVLFFGLLLTSTVVHPAVHEATCTEAQGVEVAGRDGDWFCLREEALVRR